jgi:hypothetical protein
MPPLYLARTTSCPLCDEVQHRFRVVFRFLVELLHCFQQSIRVLEVVKEAYRFRVGSELSEHTREGGVYRRPLPHPVLSRPGHPDLHRSAGGILRRRWRSWPIRDDVMMELSQR